MRSGTARKVAPITKVVNKLEGALGVKSFFANESIASLCIYALGVQDKSTMKINTMKMHQSKKGKLKQFSSK